MNRARLLIDKLVNRTDQPGNAIHTAAMLAVALEEIEQTARGHDLNEVAHFASVARLAAWDRIGIEGEV